MDIRKEEKLPVIVEEKLQEAYGKIRRGEIKQMKKKRTGYRRWTGVAAACAVLAIGSVGVLAAAAYFQKETHQETNNVSYEFDINYDLIPGEYKVTPGYLPAGFKDQGAGKYYGDDGLGITIMPVYTMAELDRLGGELSVEGQIENVEHTTLSGMKADIITFQEAKKYQSPTYIFLFNEAEGYVLHIVSAYPVGQDELLKFADSLSVERTGDAAYETEEEKAARKQQEDSEAQAMENGAKNHADLLTAGIPSDKIFGVGEELKLLDGSVGYTVTGYEYLDSIEGFDQDKFFDFTRFDGWLNADKTLKPYNRQHYDREGQLVEESLTEQQILKVDLQVRYYGDDEKNDTELDLQLIDVEARSDGSYTWSMDDYVAVPEEHYELQMDQSSVYFDKAVYTDQKVRQHFFYRDLAKGEDLSYTLLFVVDKDRKGSLFLSPWNGNYSVNQTESESVQQILSQLDGYIYLNK